jgi:hypothetical protein
LKRLAWSIFLVLPVVAGADIYRSVDENGVVVYSDLPTGSAERIAVRTAAARPAAAQPAPAAEGSEDASEDAADDSPIYAEVPREPTPEEIAEDRARNCEYSRQMLESYSTSHRLYRQGADGERQYLSDDEIDAARAKAQSNVAAWCD